MFRHVARVVLRKRDRMAGSRDAAAARAGTASAKDRRTPGIVDPSIRSLHRRPNHAGMQPTACSPSSAGILNRNDPAPPSYAHVELEARWLGRHPNRHRRREPCCVGPGYEGPRPLQSVLSKLVRLRRRHMLLLMFVVLSTHVAGSGSSASGYRSLVRYPGLGALMGLPTTSFPTSSTSRRSRMRPSASATSFPSAPSLPRRHEVGHGP